jgi:hypothetical protein
MKSKSKIIAGSSLFLLCLTVSLNAECMGDPSPPCEIFWRAQVVFIGTVTRASYSETYQKGEGEDRWNYRDRIAHFTVEESFRGKIGPEVDVIAIEMLPTPTTLGDGSAGTKMMEDSDCNYKFKQGERYLVYAQLRKTNDGTLMVGFNRTRPLAQAEDDLAFIRALDHAEPGGLIYGQAKQTKRDLADGGNTKSVGPVALVKVVAEAEGRHYETYTDSEGRYQLKGVEPGEYSVQAQFPPELTTYPPQKVRVSDHGCAQHDFHTQADDRISGKVFNAQEQIVPKMQLDLTLADQDENNPNPQAFYAFADDNGFYEFKSIPPGKYLLGIRLTAIRDPGFAYPRTFYPGVSNSRDAKVFNLGPGEKMSGVDFVLPPKLELRTVEGIVVWPDGKPVPKARVGTMITEYPYSFAWGASCATDDAGRFSCKLFDGLSYWINAVVNMPEGKQMHAEPVDLPKNGGVKELKLVVTSPMGNCERCRYRYWPPKKH